MLYVDFEGLPIQQRLLTSDLYTHWICNQEAQAKDLKNANWIPHVKN